MKAVYEMPKVSFEAFMANNAVSACGDVNKNVIFDCVMGNKKNCNSLDNVFATVLGINFCSGMKQAGFADYSQKTETAVDLDGWDDKHTSNNNNLIWNTNNDTVDVNSKDGFLGWLYIGVEKDDGKLEYEDDNGWKYSEDKGLRFDDDDDDVKHAWLAPVYSVLSTSGM
ncbi:MAG: hypothetical protein MSP08_02060 [Clostridiales bacterium]|nr:hypothetical protein [Clostridiales bacterium]